MDLARKDTAEGKEGNGVVWARGVPGMRFKRHGLAALGHCARHKEKPRQSGKLLRASSLVGVFGSGVG